MKSALPMMLAVIALTPACSAGASSKQQLVSEARKQNMRFELTAAQGPFKSKPNVRGLSGSPSDYQGPGNLWLNLLRGGYSSADYPYFLLRAGVKLDTLDVVFFDDLGRGFSVPLQKEGGDEGYYLLARSLHGGEVGRVSDRIVITLQSGDKLVAAVAIRTSAKTMGLFGTSREWSAILEFETASVSSDLHARAKGITGVIIRPK